MKTTKFQANLVKTKLTSSNKEGHWEFQNQHISGTIYEYEVEDGNFKRPLKWSFEISVPHKFLKGAYILVRCVRHPQKAYWAGLEYKSINFARATKPNYRGRVYAKLNIADVTGDKNKIGVSKGQRTLLPPYIRRFRIRLKKTVASTQGTDGNSLVAVVKPVNHRRMIRLFFALKVWVMYEGFSFEE